MIRISEKGAPMRLDQLMANHQYTRKDIKQLLARRQILVDHLPAQKLSQNIDPGLQQIQIGERIIQEPRHHYYCLLYTSPSPRDRTRSRMPSSA